MQIKSWENSRVLITGSSGFIGRHLVSYLLGKKAKILGLSRHPYNFTIEKKVDVANKAELLKAFKQFKPDACFHLASEALVEAGSIDPYGTFNNNITSALNVLEISRSYNIQRIIIASTSHVYGAAPLPYREDEPPRPSRPYETSKTCVDLIAQSYADSFNLPVLIPRFVNIYGPSDLNFSRVIPKTMQSVVSGKNPTMWGGSAKREYLYIDDAIRAYSMLGLITDSQLEKNRIYNVGTGKPISVNDLMVKIIALSEKILSIKKIENGREEELLEQVVSWGKMKRTFQWIPRTNMDRGLRLTYKWYKTIQGE
ncbi:MAG: NAD-dependent epimerase/dehydratase family protein [Patescibacteria group bacterium]